ncbi:MAG: NAD(P)/FAD-dependent oxidoreductase [Eubacteriales bacterium]|nr:NAD(P)/FAD-dependent oxidoreductase [Eubacteriales bacterium]
MSSILIVGGGASGMMAGVQAARRGHEVHILEKNEKLGKKLYITGKGRCNVTNNCDVEDLLSAVMTNPKFLYSAFYTYNSQDVMEFFEKAGVPLKTERGGRVFPVSDHSSDIIRALDRELKKAGARVSLHTEVKEILTEAGRAVGVCLADGRRLLGDRVIVATGGLSYPATGSTGDGYEFARAAGHQVKAPSPSLVPLLVREDYVRQLQGLSLKNTGLTIRSGNKTVYEDFGEMMFTHFGVTGPMILSASAHLGKYLKEGGTLSAWLDLKPALTPEQLDARILREFEAGRNKQFKNVIGALFPSSLTPVMLALGGIPPEKKVHEISRQERLAFGELVKAFPFTITGTGGFREAIITRGGVSVRDVSPNTMESRKMKNLFFIGEVLDLDGLTGGYNLQIAWSTAYLAAMAQEEISGGSAG